MKILFVSGQNLEDEAKKTLISLISTRRSQQHLVILIIKAQKRSCVPIT